MNQKVLGNELMLSHLVDKTDGEEDGSELETKAIDVISLEDEQVWLTGLYEKYSMIQSKECIM